MCDWDQPQEVTYQWMTSDAMEQEKAPHNSHYHGNNSGQSFGQNNRGQRNRFGNDSFQGSRDFNDRASRNSTTITVHSSDCGKIIGKGGCNIKEMQQQSGARIKICKDEGDYDAVPVIISGTQEAVESAQKLIENFLEENNQYNGSSRSQHQEPKKALTKDDIATFDWNAVRVQSDRMTKERWAALAPVTKDFYIEADAVSDTPSDQVALWRKNNFDLSVMDLSEHNRAPLNPVFTFEQAFTHYPEILEQISIQGFVKPSPIQSQVWPLALRGHDVIGIAQTGTGKTLAFLLPMMIHLDLQKIPRNERVGPSAVILTPTRELALQIEQEIKKYKYRNIRCVCIYGGGDRRKQISLVKSGVEIIVATPGRLNDLLSNEILSLDSCTFLVLDEADRMLDLGFEPQIKIILIDIRPDRQTLMTSATWPSGVRRLAREYMMDPFQVTVGSLDLAATHTVRQIIEIIEESDKRQRLQDFINEMEPDDKLLVFVGRKSTCDYLSSDLCLQEISCQSIHGGREQCDREQALDDFKTGYVRILIATDVASRGLDVKDITHVFNYDFPRNTEEYVHRVGRTGRAGRTGISLSLVTRDDWGSAKELTAILEEAQQEIPIELYEMADRFAKMKQRRAMQRGGGRGGYRGGRGGRRGGGFGGGSMRY